MYISRRPADFSIREVSRKMQKINLQINLRSQRPFPKPKEKLLSFYEYKRAKIRIKKRKLVGGLPRLMWCLVDFSFIRSLVADAYSPEGGPCYDPVSLILLDLFRYILGYTMKDFCDILQDKYQGASYRYYAGVSSYRIPCEADFSNLRVRIGEERYNEILHVLVKILYLLGLVSFNIISIDGTLFPSNSRYKGCNRFCEECSAIPVEKLSARLKQKILYRLENPSNIKLGQKITIPITCPSHKFPKDEKKPKIEVLTFCLEAKATNSCKVSDNIAKVLRVEDRLRRLGLSLKIIRSNINLVKLEGRKQSYFIRCPRFPSDPDARIGVRRDKRDPNREEKVFGYDAIFGTSIEPDLHLEVPISCLTSSGNADEGSYLPLIMGQIKEHHPKAHPKITLADAKHDILENYSYIRKNNQIPLIAYNSRNEDLSPEALRKRGYDQNGWPFAPCGILCRPNGYDEKRKSVCFACFKQCKDTLSFEERSSCPYWRKNKFGFTQHMKIKGHPRLILEIPRGTERYEKLFDLRPASERVNSSCKDKDNGVLSHPKVRGKIRASILSQIAAIACLLKRTFRFILNVSLRIRKLFASNDKRLYRELFLPSPIPGYLKGTVQIE